MLHLGAGGAAPTTGYHPGTLLGRELDSAPAAEDLDTGQFQGQANFAGQVVGRGPVGCAVTTTASRMVTLNLLWP
jgi:hypothetical protein